MANKKTQILTLGALMVALSTVLSFFQFSAAWLAGGSVTLFSMVPICLFAYMYGLKWGLLCGTVHGAIQLVVGMNALKGVTLLTFFGACLLDYFAAYAVLGFAGAFAKAIKNRQIAFGLGCFLAGILRFFCHFLSGFFIWDSITQSGIASVIYSFTYNIGYMGPEIVITTIGGVLLMAVLGRTPLLQTAKAEV